MVTKSAQSMGCTSLSSPHLETSLCRLSQNQRALTHSLCSAFRPLCSFKYVLHIIFSLRASILIMLQAFFVHRFWRATRKILITSFLGILVAARFALSIVLGPKSFQMTSLTEFLITSKWIMTVAWVLGKIHPCCYNIKS